MLDPMRSQGMKPMPERDRRLQEVLAAYLEALDSGRQPDRAEWQARYPDLATELAEFFANQDSLARLAQPLRAAAEAAEAPTLGPQEEPPLRLQLETVEGEDELTSTLPASAHGRKVGDYELLGEIARGGMGVVYKARQVRLNRTVAVKMILAGQFASAGDVRRFKAEAQAAANLDHPNILPVYEVGEHDGNHFFSMKFVDGKNLTNRLTKGPLTAREAAELVRICAEAVHYAHEHGVVHRDLKPGNILLARRPGSKIQGDPSESALQDWMPLITDFGLAKRMDHGTQLTATGQVLGTPSYMAPEQAAGRGRQVGPAADVYALGAILYELVTGQPPFKAATPVDTILKLLNEDPVPPTRLNRKLSRELEAICLKCLRKEPTDRYSSAAALGEDLGRFLRGEPVAARAASLARRFDAWSRRPERIKNAARVAVLAGVALGALAIGKIILAVIWQSWMGLFSSGPGGISCAGLALFHILMARGTRARRGWAVGAGLAVSLLMLALLVFPGLLSPLVRLGVDTLRIRQGVDGLVGFTMPFGLGVLGFALEPLGWLHAGFMLVFCIEFGTYALGMFALDTLPEGQARRARAVAWAGTSVVVGLVTAQLTSSRWLLVSRGWLRLKWLLSAAGAASFAAILLALLSVSLKRAVARAGGEVSWRDWVYRARLLAGVLFVIALLLMAPAGLIYRMGEPVSPTVHRQPTTSKSLGLRPRDFMVQNPVHALAFSPNSKNLSLAHSYGADRMVSSLNLESGAESQVVSWAPLVGGPVEFTADGRKVAAFSQNYVGQTRHNSLHIWELASGKKLLEADLVPESAATRIPTAIALSNDGATLVLANGDQVVTTVWNIVGDRTWPVLRIDGPLRHLALAPDGKTLAAALYGGHEVKLWDLTNGRPLRSLAADVGVIEILGFSGNGNVLAVGEGGWPSRVKLWEIPGGRLIKSLSVNIAVFTHLVISPDGKRLAWSNGRNVEFQEVASGRSILLGESAVAITALAFNPDGTVLASAGQKLNLEKSVYEGPVQVTEWDLAKLVQPPQFPQVSTPGTHGPEDPGTRLSTSSVGAQPKDFRVQQPVSALVFSSDSKSLMVGHLDSFSPPISAVQLDTGEVWQVRTDAPWRSDVMGFTQDARKAILAEDSTGYSGRAMGTPSKLVTIWDLENGKALFKADWAHLGLSVRPAVNASSDCTILMTFSRGGIVTVWNISANGISAILRIERPVQSAALAPDGKLLAAALPGGHEIQLWDTTRGDRVRSLTADAESVDTLVFSANGKVLLSAKRGQPGKVRLWELTSGRLLRSFSASLIEDTTQLAISADGKRLAWSIGRDIELQDIASERSIKLGESAVDIDALVFNPDGQLLASAGRTNVVTLAFDSEGKQIAGVGGGGRASHRVGQVTVWNLTKLPK
jgi:WD40 repeat protein/tRNA A-37 threonylcarbamoyl transferase component Bud32